MSESETGGWVARIGIDWWATIIGLTVAAAAVAGILPKIVW